MWILSSLTCLVALVTSVALILRNSDEEGRERIKAEEANLVALGLPDLISLNNWRDVIQRLPETLEIDRLNEIIRIYDIQGRLLYSNIRSAELGKVHLDRASHVNQGFYLIVTPKREYQALLRGYRALDGDIFWIEIATPRRQLARILGDISLPFGIMLLTLLAVSYFIAHRLSRNVLSPLESAAAHMESLNVQGFKAWEPLSLASQPREFQPVIRKVNELLSRIQKAFVQSRQLGQFLAHEIRTPLTVIRGEIETALMNASPQPQELADVLRSSLEEVSKIEEIISTILGITEREAKTKTYSPLSVDLPALLREIAPRIERWVNRPFTFEIDPKVPVFAFLDRELFILLVSNLLRNIARHAPRETPASVRMTTTRSDISIEIRDRGPGLSPSLLEAANSPRAEEELLGVGLNLCKEIARLNRLILRFENQPTGGLAVRISCPISSGPDQMTKD